MKPSQFMDGILWVGLVLIEMGLDPNSVSVAGPLIN